MWFMSSRSARFVLIPLITVIVSAGCGHPLQRRLQGRWLGESVENIDQSFLAAATGWAKGTSFEFSGDRITVIIPAEEPRTGTYTISSVRDNRVAIIAKRADGTLDPLELRVDDEQSLQWVLPTGSSIRMRKAN
jgi:hypothetical protein